MNWQLLQPTASNSLKLDKNVTYILSRLENWFICWQQMAAKTFTTSSYKMADFIIIGQVLLRSTLNCLVLHFSLLKFAKSVSATLNLH